MVFLALAFVVFVVRLAATAVVAAANVCECCSVCCRLFLAGEGRMLALSSDSLLRPVEATSAADECCCS